MTPSPFFRDKLPMSICLSPDEWITQAEAARRRGTSRQAINQMTRTGRVRVLAVAGRVFVNAEDVARFEPLKPGPKTSAEPKVQRLSTDAWITRAEAARRRGVAPQSIANLVRLGRLRTAEIGGLTLVSADDLKHLKPRRAPSKRQ